MREDSWWCHYCDTPVFSWIEFIYHANAGHAITGGRCPGDCQFSHDGALA